MCFSPQASFIASAILGGIGLISYRKLPQQKTAFWPQLGLVLVPICFAIQQFCEGMVWLSFLYQYPVLIKNIFAYAFVFFAFIFWPAYVPNCVYFLETSPVRRQWLQVLRCLGLGVALLLLGRLIYFGLEVQVSNCHIMYTSTSLMQPSIEAIMTMIAYLLATVGALISSSRLPMAQLGCLIGIAYGLTYWFYVQFLISVWCFFSALISAFVYRIIGRLEQ